MTKEVLLTIGSLILKKWHCLRHFSNLIIYYFQFYALLVATLIRSPWLRASKNIFIQLSVYPMTQVSFFSKPTFTWYEDDISSKAYTLENRILLGCSTLVNEPCHPERFVFTCALTCRSSSNRKYRVEWKYYWDLIIFHTSIF